MSRNDSLYRTLNEAILDLVLVCTSLIEISNLCMVRIERTTSDDDDEALKEVYEQNTNAAAAMLRSIIERLPDGR